MVKMKRYMNLHYGQIPTLRKTIRTALDIKGRDIIYALMDCFAADPFSAEYYLHLFSAALMIEQVSELVYTGKNGLFRKLPEAAYRLDIFEGWAETPEEVTGISPEDSVLIHRMLWQVADIVCPVIACASEQISVWDYAYAIDYVRRHCGDLQKPEKDGIFPFPVNYPDYDWRNGDAEMKRIYFNEH